VFKIKHGDVSKLWDYVYDNFLIVKISTGRIFAQWQVIKVYNFVCNKSFYIKWKWASQVLRINDWKCIHVKCWTLSSVFCTVSRALLFLCVQHMPGGFMNNLVLVLSLVKMRNTGHCIGLPKVTHNIPFITVSLSST
jgi:hypothetical protein